ncbi:MAG: DnaJ domain-containing protein [Halioglobus sp.]
MIPELLYLALDFYREPRRFDHLRQAGQPLPPGVTELLAAPARCLANDEIAATAAALHASEQECTDCVPFFIKQVMLEVSGDYYRILGVGRDATQAQVKEHYFYLMRLFHPDRDVHNEGWDDLYAPRINEAYNTLRNAAKRAEYDASLSPRDGFNPEQLSQGAQSSFQSAPASLSPASKQSVTPGFLRSPWFYALLAGAFVLVLFGVLLGSNQTTELTVTQVETVQGSKHAPVPDDGDTPVDRDPPKALEAPSEAMHRSASASNEDIEALVRAKVNQATVAVLGRPRPKVKVNAQAESVIEPKVVAQTEPERLPETRPLEAVENPTQASVVAHSESKVENVTASLAVPEPAKDAPIEVVSVSSPAVTQNLASDSEVSAELLAPQSAGKEKTAVKPAQSSLQTTEELAKSMPTATATATANEPESEAEIVNVPTTSALASVPSAQPLPQPQAVEVEVASADTSMAPVVAQKPETEMPTLVSDADVEALLSQFASTYEAGDAARFARYFSTDARTTDADGRPAIESLYAGFFAETDVQAFNIERLKIKGGDALQRDCRASVKIVTRPVSGGELTEVETDIRFDIGRDSRGALQITRMRY